MSVSAREERINHLFHLLWTQAASKGEYEKSTWLELQRLLQLQGILV